MDTITWWGEFTLNSEQTGQWQIGPLKLAVQQLAHEWQITFEEGKSPEPDENSWDYMVTATEVGTLNYATTERYSFTNTGEHIHLTPALADRPMVTRPTTPFYVPPAEQTTLFVSSPLWVRLEAGNPLAQLREIPVQRPSDTWFGSSTQDGELCYASHTKGRLNLKNIPRRFHRAITQVVIHNQAESMLMVERLSLPVPYLSLYATTDGFLWTEAVTMVRTYDTGMANFHIEAGPSEQVGETRLVSIPRQQPSQNMMTRAFGVLSYLER